MDEFWEDIHEDFENEKPEDQVAVRARQELVQYFQEHKDKVCYSRQLEVMLEKKYFHWITRRVLRNLVDEKFLLMETRALSTGGRINLFWHKSYRYYRRDANKIVNIVEEYANSGIGAALGINGEFLVLEAFAQNEFLLKGRNSNSYNGQKWVESEHDLDFIFEKDGRAYGIEVKNKLDYIDYDELIIKIELCKKISIIPVFVVRMMPRTWIKLVVDNGGFVLVLGFQLYPLTHKDLATRIASELGLPVDTPRSLQAGTMERFMKWHRKNL